MAFNMLGDVAELCFDPHFAPIQRFLQATSERFSADIMLMRDGHKYMLSFGSITTLGERYIHLSWRHMQYWTQRRLTDGSHEVSLGAKHETLVLHNTPFPENLVDLSLKLPADLMIARDAG